MLSSNLNSEVMTETSMGAHFLHAFQVLSELGVDHVSDELGVGTVLGASLSVKEPGGDSVFGRLGEDVVNLDNFFFGQIAGSAVEVDLCNLEHEVGESSADSLDASEGELGFMFAVDVGVLHTQQVYKFGCSWKN